MNGADQEEIFELVESDKEIVIYRGGWGFVLPEQHQVRVDEEGNRVSISYPQAGGIYTLERVEETEEEHRIYVAPGGPIAAHAVGTRIEAAYPFPTIDVELERLAARFERFGGAPQNSPGHPDALARQQFDSWAQGDSHDTKTTRMRAAVRTLQHQQ